MIRILFIENNATYFDYSKSFGITFLKPPITTLLSDMTSITTSITVSKIQVTADYTNNTLYDNFSCAPYLHVKC